MQFMPFITSPCFHALVSATSSRCRRRGWSKTNNDKKKRNKKVKKMKIREKQRGCRTDSVSLIHKASGVALLIPADCLIAFMACFTAKLSCWAVSEDWTGVWRFFVLLSVCFCFSFVGCSVPYFHMKLTLSLSYFRYSYYYNFHHYYWQFFITLIISIIIHIIIVIINISYILVFFFLFSIYASQFAFDFRERK